MNAISTFRPSLYQQRYFDWLLNGTGSAVLKAVAGSGKSTTLGEGLVYIPEHKHVQIFMFNAPIATDFKERLVKLAAKYNRPFAHVRAGTFHSVGMGAILKYLGKPFSAIECTGSKCRKLARDKFSPDENELYGAFACKLVSFAKGEGIGALIPDTEDEWYKLIAHHNLSLDAQDADEATGVAMARKLLAISNAAAREGFIDFDDQLYLVCLWRLRLWQNDFVLIDEAQDTNRVRRAIAKLALKPGGRLIAVGDDRQAIYGFTGASHDAIDLIKREFNAIELPLTISYRCSTAVGRHCQELVPYFETHADAPEGSVEFDVSIEAALKVLGPNDMILCRNVAPLIDLCYDLIGRNIGCRVLGREIGDALVDMIKAMRAKGIDALREKLEAYAEREIAKHIAKGEEGKAEGIEDRVTCIFAIMGKLNENERTVPALVAKINGLFTNNTEGLLTLSSMHKAKGREAVNVAILKPELCPSKYARQDWQRLQEENLMYVARSRAMLRLMYLAA